MFTRKGLQQTAAPFEVSYSTALHIIETERQLCAQLWIPPVLQHPENSKIYGGEMVMMQYLLSSEHVFVVFKLH